MPSARSKASGAALGAVGGAVVGLILEFINGLLAFMLPPLLVLLPLCVALGAVIGMRLRRDA